MNRRVEVEPPSRPWALILPEVLATVEKRRGARLAGRFRSALSKALADFGGRLQGERILAPPLPESMWRVAVEAACAPVVAVAGRNFVDMAIAEAEEALATAASAHAEEVEEEAEAEEEAEEEAEAVSLPEAGEQPEVQVEEQVEEPPPEVARQEPLAVPDPPTSRRGAEERKAGARFLSALRVGEILPPSTEARIVAVGGKAALGVLALMDGVRTVEEIAGEVGLEVEQVTAVADLLVSSKAAFRYISRARPPSGP